MRGDTLLAGHGLDIASRKCFTCDQGLLTLIHTGDDQNPINEKFKSGRFLSFWFTLYRPVQFHIN